MKRVTGIGGVFFKAKDAKALTKWYHTHLGITPDEGGGSSFFWRDTQDASRVGRTVWSVFPGDTSYFTPSASPFMINFRVDDLDRVLTHLRDEGVQVLDTLDDDPNGRFAWILDPEGNKIELWEPRGEEGQ